MNHAILSVVVTILASFVGNVFIGALLISGFYIGREVTQAEYRWISQYGAGKRANMPWWGGFDPRAWNRKALLDWILPVIVSFTLAYLLP